MDANIEGTLNSLIGGFDQYEITNPSIQKEVDAFIKKLMDFGYQSSDVAQFYTKYTEEGIAEEYSALITKVAMASMGATNDDGSFKTDYSDTPDKKESDLPSVHDFLEQYRIPYNEICKNNSPRAKCAYEAIFNVENRADNLIEAQIILESERLLWNIVRDGALDSLLDTLKKMDPLFLATTAKLLGQIKIYNEVNCEEALTYRLDIQELVDQKVIGDYVAKMNLTVCLALELIEYLNAKDEVYAWRKQVLVEGGVMSMYKHRYNIRVILEFMKNYMDTTFDDILNNESLKIWLLNPHNIDEYGKRKKILNTQYYDLYKNVIDNEIIPDKTIYEILTTS